jgi:iron complex transport system permease protein
LAGLLALMIVLGLKLAFGEVKLPFTEAISILFGAEANDERHYLIVEQRWLRALTAFFAGSGLAVCGLMLQSFFRNPLAGPSVIGISSGASMGVALFYLGSAFFGVELGYLGEVGGALFGAGLVMLLLFLSFLRRSDTVSILLVGMMLAFVSGSISSILIQYADAGSVKQYIQWGFASFSGVEGKDMLLFCSLCVIPSLLFFGLSKGMDQWMLGKMQAHFLGLNTKRFPVFVLGISVLLSAWVTAWCGPVGFIGLAVPHIVKNIMKTRLHAQLIPFTFLFGGILAVLCDWLSSYPTPLPLNAISSLFGVPVIFWVIFKNKHLQG